MSEITDIRASYLRSLNVLWSEAQQTFEAFKRDCQFRNGGGCDHPNYHHDFALANVCRLVDCPLIQDEDLDREGYEDEPMP